jgi:response regulator RpfG family c-di-GMP phosphodiesterase
MMFDGSSVLVIDDSIETTELLSDCLTMNACNVLKADTGNKALQILRQNDIDVAIVDINLPDMNGISLLDPIKTHDPSIAIVMITGYPEPNFVVDAMKKGASDFLVKPFDLDKLMIVMMRVMRERELLREKKDILDRLEDKKKIEMLNRQLQKKIEELSIMFHISNSLNGLSIVDDVYEKMLHLVREVLNPRSCAFYLADHDNQELILVMEHRDNGTTPHDRRLVLSDDFVPKSGLSMKYLTHNGTIFLPLAIKDQRVGYIAVEGRKGKGVFPSDDLFLLKLVAEKAAIKIENKMLYESLYNSILDTLSSLIIAIDRRDSYTKGHCERVADMCSQLGERMGISDYEKSVLRIVGPIHDLGKIGIADEILLKPGGLTNEEYEIMKGHSAMGEEIIKRFEILAEEAKIIRHHHERFDGRGYPDQLAGASIPLCSRITAVCDAYDAMTSNRPYRNALTQAEAMKEITAGTGKQFDPEAANAFISILNSEAKAG